MDLILASASPRRSELLTLAGYSFKIIPSDAEETVPEGTNAPEMCEALSRLKARDVAAKVQRGSIVIGADTVVEINGTILGKPKNSSDAFRMLKMLSGNTHTVYTGVTLIKEDSIVTFSEKTPVTFYQLTDSEIDAYIGTGEPMDKAGAYGIQGLGCVLVKGIIGDYFNVMGLPISRVSREIKKLIKE